MDTELELLRLSSASEKESIEEIANALYQRQAEIGKLNSLLAEYEDYVEKWAHEIKLPLSLLSLLWTIKVTSCQRIQLLSWTM